MVGVGVMGVCDGVCVCVCVMGVCDGVCVCVCVGGCVGGGVTLMSQRGKSCLTFCSAMFLFSLWTIWVFSWA